MQKNIVTFGELFHLLTRSDQRVLVVVVVVVVALSWVKAEPLY